MQGEPENRNGNKVYRFHQKVPIQSYLIAIAAGRIESRKIGPRSHVWSEKEYGRLLPVTIFPYGYREIL